MIYVTFVDINIYKAKHMSVINNDENNISRIRTILNNHKATTAFLIGNGIHYQYKDCNIPWKKLLEDLWSEYTGKQEEIPGQ